MLQLDDGKERDLRMSFHEEGMGQVGVIQPGEGSGQTLQHGHWLLIPQWHLLAGRSVGVTCFSLGAAHFCIFLLVVSTSLFRAGYFSALADS